MLIISAKNPLSAQLQKLTGDAWSETDFETGRDKEIIIHKKTGQLFIALTTAAYASLEESGGLKSQLDYFKKAYDLKGISMVTNINTKPRSLQGVKKMAVKKPAAKSKKKTVKKTKVVKAAKTPTKAKKTLGSTIKKRKATPKQLAALAKGRAKLAAKRKTAKKK